MKLGLCLEEAVRTYLCCNLSRNCKWDCCTKGAQSGQQWRSRALAG